MKEIIKRNLTFFLDRLRLINPLSGDWPVAVYDATSFFSIANFPL